MGFARIFGALIAVVCALLAQRASAQTNAVGDWSTPTNGLTARLVLVQKVPTHVDPIPGTRWLVPYLELRNVRNLANPMEVDCGRGHLQVELLDAEGRPAKLHSRRTMYHFGPACLLGTIVLPLESSISISLECKTWSIPHNAVAMISADSGAWVLDEIERDQVYLRATLSGEWDPTYKRWSGRIQTPLIKVDWK
jgi:hypothetical protein